MSERAFIKTRISHDHRYIVLVREKDRAFYNEFLFTKLWRVEYKRPCTRSLCDLEDRRILESKANEIQSIQYVTKRLNARLRLESCRFFYSCFFSLFSAVFWDECLALFLSNDKVDEHVFFSRLSSQRYQYSPRSFSCNRTTIDCFRIKTRSFASRKPLLPRKAGFSPIHDFGRTRWLTVTKSRFHNHRSRSRAWSRSTVSRNIVVLYQYAIANRRERITFYLDNTGRIYFYEKL